MKKCPNLKILLEFETTQPHVHCTYNYAMLHLGNLIYKKSFATLLVIQTFLPNHNNV